MSHQPFENCFFSKETLDQEQHNELNLHLASCKDCQQLSLAFESIEETFYSTNLPVPEPGFSYRWHQRLQLHKQQSQQRKIWFFTVGGFVFANVIFMILIVCNVININFSQQLGQTIANFGLLAARIRQFQTAITNIFIAFPLTIPLIIGAGLALLTLNAFLAVTWLASIIKLFKLNPEGVNIK
jgi:hypothetical protein